MLMWPGPKLSLEWRSWLDVSPQWETCWVQTKYTEEATGGCLYVWVQLHLYLKDDILYCSKSTLSPTNNCTYQSWMHLLPLCSRAPETTPVSHTAGLSDLFLHHHHHHHHTHCSLFWRHRFLLFVSLTNNIGSSCFRKLHWVIFN